MEQTVHIEKVGTIPDGATVFHYDQLDEELMDCFPALAESAPTQKSIQYKDVFSDGDYVKFIDYYRITCQ